MPLSPTTATTRTLWVCLSPALVAIGLYLLAQLMPQDHVWGHILQSLMLALGPWLAALGVLCCVWAGWRWRRPMVWLPLFIGYLYVVGPPPWLVHSALPGLARARQPAQGLVIVSANLDAFSPGPPGAEQALVALDPDVLAVIEERAPDIPGMVRVADNYAVPMPRISHGHAIHCRPGLSCDAAITPEFGSDSSHMPMGLLRVPVPRIDHVGDTMACLMSLHAPPPAPLNPTGLLPYVRRVAAAVRGGRLVRQWGPCLGGDPVLMLGDFNHVPGSPAWRILTGDADDEPGLLDADDVGSLWRASWPAGGGWPNLPFFSLDHALVSPALIATGLRRERIPGADHLALVLRLQAQPPVQARP
ncbi:MAG: endonuclease/exonuclease/phosphatase family protein [Oligoflexia bacterium]|nr:endonuclease/exonuclease/phosphatase family protein [Oligoflexia bacterium]